MKKYISTGLIILLPIALTLYLVFWLFDILTDPFIGVTEKMIVAYEQAKGVDLRNHEVLVAVISRIFIFIVLIFFIFVLGFVGRKFFFKQLVGLSQKILKKIPVIKTIYSITSDVTSALLKQGEPTFKGTVLIPFPYKETYTLGLVTGEVPPGLRKVLKEVELSVFIPTAPHPISGYILMAPRSQMVPVDVTTEEAFRFLLSCGVAPLEEKKYEGPVDTRGEL